MIETVLSIAGSDSTGGAGIQADIKTMTVIGVYAAAAVTCITVQNSRGVGTVAPLPPDLVAGQIKAVLDDHHVTHIKIGMVGSGEIARAIGAALAAFTGEVVLDPVLISTTGQELMNRDELAEYLAFLLPVTTVLTPNLPELSALTGMPLSGRGSLQKAAESLFARSGRLRAVLIKGGHVLAKDTLTDHLVYREKDRLEISSISHPVIDSPNTHGTGCTLASAFTAYHCLGADYCQAFSRSVEFLQKKLAAGQGMKIVNNPHGAGGLPLHMRD